MLKLLLLFYLIRGYELCRYLYIDGNFIYLFWEPYHKWGNTTTVIFRVYLQFISSIKKVAPTVSPRDRLMLTTLGRAGLFLLQLMRKIS